MPLRPALLAFLLLATCPALAAEPVRAVERLDIDRYAGQWHEIAHLPVSFQKQCVGDITANYGCAAMAASASPMPAATATENAWLLKAWRARLPAIPASCRCDSFRTG